MAVSMEFLLCLCIWAVLSSLGFVSSTSSMPACHLQSPSLLDTLQSKCPLSFSPISPLEVNGYFLDRTLTSQRGSGYIAMLFYASWCPFSHDTRLIFEALSSMFPQIEHLAIEQSSAMPSVFSRYGIHSFPTILMVSQTSRIHFRGPKDLHFLVEFYKKVTGFEPVHYVTVDQSTCSRKGSFLNEISTMEPYLLFSLLFLCLKVLVFVYPKLVSRLRAFWVSCVPPLRLEIFGETSQILGRVLHIINVKSIWAKLKLCKVRNFRKGAKNAQVWASSLASVSLGETSSLKSSL
ncbi:5-adenylylsulfate reductase-like [Sarracenia purpurea var. burkii]